MAAAASEAAAPTAKAGSGKKKGVHVGLENNECRYYEQKYPEVGELCVVLVKSVQEMGAYVELLQYNRTEGMILLSELSRRRIRSINKLVRVGRTEIVIVLRVDTEKGYIDLSKKRVSPEDVAACEAKYAKSKIVHSILRTVSEKSRVRLEDLYTKFGWDLYRQYGHAHDAFKLIVTEPERILAPYKLDKPIFDLLVRAIRERLTPQAVRLRADLELSCFSYEGIDAIKAALRAGEACSTAEMQIKIRLVAPPLYVMMASTMDQQSGIKELEAACAAVEKVIKEKGGDLNLKNPPRAVTDRDDKALTLLMESLEKQNQEVSGDDD